MCECLTKPIMPDYSGCLVENPTCQFAVRFGFSYHCEHPQHMDFHMIDANFQHQKGHNERYRDLKESRKKEYLFKVKQYMEDFSLA